MKKSGTAFLWAAVFEVVPAVIFGGAAGFSSAAILGTPLGSTTPVAGGAAAFGFAWLLLRRLGAPPSRLRLPEFALQPVEPQVADELLLDDVVDQPASQEDELVLEDEFQPDDELVLEDPLPPVEEDSRVIRMFDPAKMQSAGELQARIERHLRDAPRQPMPDATQELHDALAALRQSLR